jgi:hypothetical protein
MPEHDRTSHLSNYSMPSSSYRHNPKAAPARFGSAGRNKHRPLEKDEDVRGGRRLDEDGMVYDMGGGVCTYFQDRMRQYPFATGAAGLSLLRRLLVVNRRVFALSDARVLATDDPRRTAREGERLYVEKPSQRSAPKGAGVGTWSDEEYAHPGLQALYLRLKSFQRFTESWALYERAAALGIFDPWVRPAGVHVSAQGATAQGATAQGATAQGASAEGATDDKLAADGFTSAESVGARSASGERCGERPLERPKLCVASLGGGPGYELLALAWYLRELATKRGVRPPRLDLVSLDLQPSWDPFVRALPEPMGGESESEHAMEGADTTYRFAQWDIKAGVGACEAAGSAIDLCLISNVLVYCTDEPSADVLTSLLQSGVRAILVNERNGEQRMVGMVQKRGVVVCKLLDQSSAAGRDDRQLLFLPEGTPAPSPVPRDLEHTFPNVPYEEAKKGSNDARIDRY